MGKRDARKETRECFMQLLFEMDMQQDYGIERKERFWTRLEGLRDYQFEDAKASSSKKTSPERAYFDSMYDFIIDNLTEIDQVLTSSSDNWKLERISRVDLAILRLAVAELLYFEDVPSSVSINEAVDLAKKFGTEDSGKFVNGILGNVVRGKDEIET